MARLSLAREEVDQDGLPNVCMKCGAKATVCKRKTFVWPSPLVFFLMGFYGPLVSEVVGRLLTKRMTVSVPFCDRHKNHWEWRTSFLVVSVFSFLIPGLVGYVLSIARELQGSVAQGVGSLMCLGTLAGCVVWLIVVAIIQSVGIRPTEITDHTITLTNVSPVFVEALEIASGDLENEPEHQRLSRQLPRGVDSEGIQDRGLGE
jgi:hypothetical protein